MPQVVAAGTLIKRPEELVEFLADAIEKSNLPFESILKYDQDLVTEYPVVQIVPGAFDKQIGGTHTFELIIRADMYVMHGNMTESYVTRSLNDMLLATSVVQFLEGPNLSLDGRLVQGYVDNERPGVMPPRVSKGSAIVVTRLGYRAESRARF